MRGAKRRVRGSHQAIPLASESGVAQGLSEQPSRKESVTGRREQVRRCCLSWVFPVGLLCIAGCSSLERLPAVPQAETHQATFLDIPNARFVIDETPPVALIAEFKGALEREIAYNRSIGKGGPLPPANYLALSGGGDNGAFGAGLLVGWSERRTRPVFKAVTGVSTGALSAPFAFLGADYDFALTNVYTKSDVGDIFTKRPLLAAVADDALTDTAPLHRLISSYIDDNLVEKIAREYDKGRLLLI
jgi:hypothetical protein